MPSHRSSIFAAAATPLRAHRARLFGLAALLVAALALITPGAVEADIPASERAVLIDLYVRTNGDSWADNTNWNGAEGTECAWYGITCDAESGHVTRIELPANRLTGPLPPLGALAALERIDLDSNQLNGSIPPLSGLTRLQYVDLSRNYSLTGSIPSLSGLSALTTFYVYQDNLVGALPSLSGLTALENFYAYSNQLSGPIPALSGLSALSIFSVSSNRLSGPIPALTGTPALLDLDLAYNRLSGSIPDLSGHPALLALAAQGNRLDGSIPPLAGIATLRYFNVAGNFLSGTIPELRGLGALALFDVSSNQLTGSIPALTGLRALQHFAASNNLLTGTLPDLTGLTALQDFSAGVNTLSGSIPSLTGLTALRSFDVSRCGLTGTIPALSGLTSLTGFGAAGNQLTGPIPALAGLTSLSGFDVHGNRLSGSIPVLTGLTNLRDFQAYANQLDGSIPPISGLINLRTFSVADNRLSGPFPTLTSLGELETFSVADNQLTGSISDLTAETSLRYFYAQNNRLTGPIPYLGGQYFRLYAFFVYGNQLSGRLPQAPPHLLPGRSRICPNALDLVDDPDWNLFTGTTPWWRDCQPGSVLTVAGTLEAKSLQTLQATGGGARYDWDVDGSGVIGRSGAPSMLNVSYPTEFDGSIAVAITSPAGVRTSASKPLKTEAARLSVGPTSFYPIQELCGDGDGVAQPGKRFSVPVVATNNGAVPIRDGYALFAARDRIDAAAAGQGVAGKLTVETPLVAVGTLEPFGVDTSERVYVSLAADAQCGSRYDLMFRGGVDGVSFSAGSQTPIATFAIPAGAACHPYTGSCAVPSKVKALNPPREGLYLNANRPGNGLSNFIIPVAGAAPVYFGAWFTGADDRTPTWYIIQGPLVSNVAVAPIYKFTRDVSAPSFSVHSAVVGQAVVVQKSTEQLTLNWQIGARSGIELMQYFVGGPVPANNRTGAWYNPGEPGWGQVVHQYDVGGQNNSFIVDYLYDAQGQPRWVLTQGPTADLMAATPHQTFQVHCPGCSWISDWNNLPAAVGNGSETFTDSTHGVINTAFTLPDPYAGTWNRNNLPITLLTSPH